MIPTNLQPAPRQWPNNFCDGANGQALNITQIYIFKLQVVKTFLILKLHMICNLQEDAILGMDFTHAHQVAYVQERRSHSRGTSHNGNLELPKLQMKSNWAPLSVTFIWINPIIEGRCLPGAQAKQIVRVAVYNESHLPRGLYCVQPIEQGQAVIPIWNCTLNESSWPEMTLLEDWKILTNWVTYFFNYKLVNAVATSRKAPPTHPWNWQKRSSQKRCINMLEQ